MTTLNLRVSSSGDDGWVNPTTFSDGPLQLVHGQNSFYRFANVSIPTGAVIEWASLLFECAKDFNITTGLSSSGHRSNVYGVLDSNPTPPTDFTNMENDFTWTTANTVWELGDWQSGIKYETPNIGPVVQEIINQPGWNANQAMMFFVEGTGNYSREAYSYEQNSNKAVRLDVDWHTPHLFSAISNQDWKNTGRVYPSGLTSDPPGLANWFKLGNPLTTSATVTTASHDGEWFTGSFDSASQVLTIGRSAGVNRNQFFRFPAVNIPLSIITSGSLELGAQATGNIVHVAVFGNQTATPIAPTNEAQANALVRTTASGSFAVTTPNPNGLVQIGNLAPIIQEIVTLGGWASGNAMMIMTYGQGSVNSSFLTSAQHASPLGPAPKLNIEFRPIVPFTAADTTILGANDGMQTAFATTTTPTISSIYLVCDNFSHTVPLGATIHGVEVRMRKNKHIDIPTPHYTYDASVRLVKNGIIQDQDQAKTEVDWGQGEIYEVYGGSGDKWGLTDLTASDVNSSNFGVAIRGYTSAVGYIDHVQMKVYYSNYGETTKNTTLFMFGHELENDNIPLYISGPIPQNDDITMFTMGILGSTSSTSLYIAGPTLHNDDTFLYTYGYDYDSGNIPLITDGHLQTNSNFTLYLHGHTTASGNTILFSHGHDSGSNDFTCFIEGITVSTNTLPLHIVSIGSGDNNTSLFIEGSIETTNQATMFTHGLNQDSGSMNMFLHAGTWNTDNDNIPLAIYGASPGSTGMISSLPFFMEGGDFRGEMNMFMAGPSYDTKTSSMNMFIGGIGTEVNNSIHMYIGCSGLEESVPLFIQGLTLHESTNPFFPNAGIPDTGIMNLFLKRPITDMVTFFIMNANTADSLTMFIRGGVGSESGISLYTAGEDTVEGPTTLYTHGF